MSELIWHLILNAICFGAGLYIGHRTWAGVKSDIGDIKDDVTKIKAQVQPTAVPVIVQPQALVNVPTRKTKAKRQ